MKNNTKTEEKLTCRFKTDMRNFTNFDPSTQKSKKLCLYYLSTYFLSYKSTEELPFMTVKRCKFEQKLTCGLEKDKVNLVNFH